MIEKTERTGGRRFAAGSPDAGKGVRFCILRLICGLIKKR